MPKRKVKRAYEPDDGPLTPEYIAALRLEAAKHMPTGQVLHRVDLFPELEKMAKSLWEPSAIEDSHFEQMKKRLKTAPRFLTDVARDDFSTFEGSQFCGDPRGSNVLKSS